MGMGTDPHIVILISAGRSGSKYLRDLLGASPRCAVVPYDINFVWRYGNERQRDDALDPASLGGQQREWIRSKVLKLAGWRPGSGTTVVVEKSVPNSLRVPFVLAVFPEAKLIHLVRDGRAVAESSRRVWNERPDLRYSLQKLRYLPLGNVGYLYTYARNLLRPGDGARSLRTWGPRYPGIEQDLATLPLLDVCARQWKECVGRSVRALQQVPGELLHEVRFEDVVSDADRLAAVCRFAGLADDEAVLRAWRERSDQSNVDKWRSVLTAGEVERISALMQPELRHFRYGE